MLPVRLPLHLGHLLLCSCNPGVCKASPQRARRWGSLVWGGAVSVPSPGSVALGTCKPRGVATCQLKRYLGALKREGRGIFTCPEIFFFCYFFRLKVKKPQQETVSVLDSRAVRKQAAGGIWPRVCCPLAAARRVMPLPSRPCLVLGGFVASVGPSRGEGRTFDLSLRTRGGQRARRVSFPPSFLILFIVRETVWTRRFLRVGDRAPAVPLASLLPVTSFSWKPWVLGSCRSGGLLPSGPPSGGGFLPAVPHRGALSRGPRAVGVGLLCLAPVLGLHVLSWDGSPSGSRCPLCWEAWRGAVRHSSARSPVRPPRLSSLLVPSASLSRALLSWLAPWPGYFLSFLCLVPWRLRALCPLCGPCLRLCLPSLLTPRPLSFPFVPWYPGTLW